MRTKSDLVFDNETIKVCRAWVEPENAQEEKLLDDSNKSFMGDVTKKLRAEYFGFAGSFLQEDGEVEYYRNRKNPNCIVFMVLKEKKKP